MAVFTSGLFFTLDTHGITAASKSGLHQLAFEAPPPKYSAEYIKTPVESKHQEPYLSCMANFQH